MIKVNNLVTDTTELAEKQVTTDPKGFRRVDGNGFVSRQQLTAREEIIAHLKAD